MGLSAKRRHCFRGVRRFPRSFFTVSTVNLWEWPIWPFLVCWFSPCRVSGWMASYMSLRRLVNIDPSVARGFLGLWRDGRDLDGAASLTLADSGFLARGVIASGASAFGLAVSAKLAETFSP